MTKLRTLKDVEGVQPVLSFMNDSDEIPIWKDVCIVHCDELVDLAGEYLDYVDGQLEFWERDGDREQINFWLGFRSCIVDFFDFMGVS